MKFLALSSVFALIALTNSLEVNLPDQGEVLEKGLQKGVPEGEELKENIAASRTELNEEETEESQESDSESESKESESESESK